MTVVAVRAVRAVRDEKVESLVEGPVPVTIIKSSCRGVSRVRFPSIAVQRANPDLDGSFPEARFAALGEAGGRMSGTGNGIGASTIAKLKAFAKEYGYY